MIYMFFLSLQSDNTIFCFLQYLQITEILTYLMPLSVRIVAFLNEAFLLHDYIYDKILI